MRSRKAPLTPLAFAVAALIALGGSAQAQEVRLEAENLRVLPEIDPTGPQPTVQQMGIYGNQWGNNAHLWFRATGPGQSFRLSLPVSEAKSYQVVAHFTRAGDYGIVQVSLDGAPAGAPFDGYGAGVTRSEAIDLGTFDLAAGDHTLTFKVTGKNTASASYMVGVDVIILRPSQFAVVVPGTITVPAETTEPAKKPGAAEAIAKAIADAIAAAAAGNKPDLKVRKFDPAHAEQIIKPFPPVVGEQTLIVAEFMNAGKVPVASPFFVDLYVDNELVRRWTYGPPSDPLPLKGDEWHHFLDTISRAAGPHEIKVVVDAENQIAELDESRESNQMVFQATWLDQTDLPDLVIEEIVPEGPLMTGAKQNWKVKVVNEGKTAVRNQCWVQLVRGDGKTLAGQVDPLPPQAFKNVFIEAEPVNEPMTLKWTATVDHDSRVKESDENNNTKEVSFDLKSPNIPLQVAKLTFDSSQKAGEPPTDAKWTFTPHPIDPGSIPATFVHTWQLALREIDSFRLAFSPLMGNPKIRFTWGDKLSVIDSTGKTLATLKSTDDVKNTVVKCKRAAVAEDDIAGYTRLYLVLETSEVTGDRWMKLEALAATQTPTGKERALVLEDEIDYSAPADAQFVAAYDSLGNPMALPAPWWGDTSPTGGTSLKPDPGQGWYLLGSNLSSPFGMDTKTPSPSFYSLVYYNEIEGMLRVYLNNWEMAENLATGFQVEIGLLGRVGPGPAPPLKQLKGAFFPVDPSPDNWSTARFVFKSWPIRTWRVIEIPMLYPTAEDLALAGKPVAGRNYAIYEEQLRDGARNVRIQVTVTAFQEGKLQASLVGQAIGDAVQDFTKNGQDTFTLKNVYNAIKQGYDWYSAADKFSDSVTKTLAKLPDSGLKEAGKWAARGASCMAGPIGIAGAAISLIVDLLGGSKDPEPLKMSIELALTGKIEGTVTMPGPPCTTWCYLPGRFSIQEAFQPAENLVKGDQRAIASRLPRYDRTMGLFGYAYNPGKVVMEAVREDFYDHLADAYHDYPNRSILHLPEDLRSPAKPNDPPWKAAYAAQIKKSSLVLPIIYNPYAGIQPPGASATAKAFAQNVVYGRSRFMWQTDKFDPWQACCPLYQPAIPQTYAAFKDTTAYCYAGGSPMMCPEPGKPYFANPTYWPDSRDFNDDQHEKGWTEKDFDEFDANLLHPILNIIQVCNIPYDRTLRDGRTVTREALLSSPISVNLVRWLVDKEGEKPTKQKLYQVKSELMQNLTLKDLGM